MARTVILVGIIVVSDRVAAGEAQDRSGPALTDAIRQYGSEWEVIGVDVVPDEQAAIQAAVLRLTDGENGAAAADVVVTSGGTGFSARDRTPEAVLPLLERQAPGLATAMLLAGLAKTPLAALSRAVCGMRGRSVVVTVPGSPRGAVESLGGIAGVLPHAVELVRGGAGAGEALHLAMGVQHLEVARMATVVAHAARGAEGGGCGRHDHQDHHVHVHGDLHPISNDPSAPVTRRARSSPYPMVSLDSAIATILANTHRLPPISLDVQSPQLVGHVLASDVVASENVPAVPTSIVDGYAVVATDGPGDYPVIGRATAGTDHNDINQESDARLPQVTPGHIARVTTGAPVPPGTTAVVMVEDTTLVATTPDGTEESIVRINVDSTPGAFIRTPGSDIHIGEIVLRANTILSAIGGDIGTLASIGMRTVSVHRRPVVGVVSTGNEIVDAFTTDSDHLAFGSVRDANRPALMAAIRSAGFDSVDLGIVRDCVADLTDRLKSAIQTTDIIITTGGVSMGEKDVVKPVLERELGGTLHFGRVNIKPGKPTTFATVPIPASSPYTDSPSHESDTPQKHRLVFALPGNPVSSLVAFHVFVMPCIRKMAGYPSPYTSPVCKAVLSHDVACDAYRPEYMRVVLTQNTTSSVHVPWVAHVTGTQRSSRITSVVGATGLAIIPPISVTGTSRFNCGSVVDVVVIGNPFM